MKSITINVADTKLTLLPQRAIWWQAHKTLFLADVHLGKDATFVQANLHLNNHQTRDMLKRLTHLIQGYNAKKLVILGDWIHAAQGLTASIFHQIQEWYSQHPALEITLIMGNHDQGINNLPTAPYIHITSEPYSLHPFMCWHYPHNDTKAYNLCGHLHPNITLRGKGGQQLTLSCFWQRSNSIILPAFTTFSGQIAIRPEIEDKVYVVTGNSILRAH